MDETPEEWLEQLFEFEYCAECGGDAADHEVCLVPGIGNYFARCRRPNDEPAATEYGVGPDGIREPDPPPVIGCPDTATDGVRTTPPRRNVMIISIAGSSCFVYREPGDCPFRPNRSRHSWSPPGWYGAESRLLYNVLKVLNGRGYSLIKKRMWRDGHMFGSDHTQYLRGRHLKAIPSLYIYHADYALQVAAESYNVLGRARFDVVYGTGREDDPDFERACREWVRRKEAECPCHQVSWEAKAVIDGCASVRRHYRGFTDLDQARALLRGEPGESCRLIDRHAVASPVIIG